MIDIGDHEDGVVLEEQIDWNNLFADIPMSEVPNDWSEPDFGSIEQFLMNDNDDQVPDVEADIADRFFSDVFVEDSPVDSSCSDSNNKTSDSEKVNDVAEQKEDNVSNVSDDVVVEEEEEEENDPTTKKRKRQLRNRDAAVRSRERKKMYVRDLEMKSKYFEAECRRLGMLLQCAVAENHALRVSLHNSKAADASMTKQESAVLFMESLLLGSLLWLMGIIICLFILPKHPQSTPLESGSRGSLGPRKERSKLLRNIVFKSFMMMGKTCKAARSRMKPAFFVLEVKA